MELIKYLREGGESIVEVGAVLLGSGHNFAEGIVESRNGAIEMEGRLQERSRSLFEIAFLDGHIDIDGGLLAFGAR